MNCKRNRQDKTPASGVKTASESEVESESQTEAPTGESITVKK